MRLTKRLPLHELSRNLRLQTSWASWLHAVGTGARARSRGRGSACGAFGHSDCSDNQTRSMLDTPQRYPRAGSQSYPTPAAVPNADGSTTIYFSPTQPAGIQQGNWIQTPRPSSGWWRWLASWRSSSAITQWRQTYPANFSNLLLGPTSTLLGILTVSISAEPSIPGRAANCQNGP
jgi:hypothetical protein